MRQFVLCVIGWVLFFSVEAQINWISWETAVEEVKTEAKKIVVKIYSEDCVWCKRMNDQTLNEPPIIDYVNQNFYAVAFDANSKDEIKFKDRTYQFVKKGGRGYHELAAEMTRGNLSFPSIVFFDEDLDIIQSMSGYKEKELFFKILTYFGHDYYKSIPWSEYQNQPLAFPSVRE